MGSTGSSHPARFFGLDLLRFLAIALVLFEHGSRYLKPALNNERFFYIFGYFGVELFFVLSGFLIGTILIKLYEQEQKLSMGLLRDFWIRRWYRTLPLYYLVLTLNILAHELWGSSSHSTATYLSFFGFVQNAVTQHPRFFGEAWSLSVEEWFYLSFPLVLLAFDRLLASAGRVGTVKSRLLLSIVLFFAAVVSLRAAVVEVYDPSWNTGIRKMMPLRLDAILMGVYFSWLNFYFRSLLYRIRHYLTAAGACLLICCGFVYYFDIYLNPVPCLFTKTGYFTLTDLACALFLPAALHLQPGNAGVTRKVITHVSLASYSIYLVHQSLVIRFLSLLGSPDSLLSSAFYYAAYLGLTLSVSLLLYRYYEIPMTNLREHFKKKPLKEAAPLEPVAQ